MTSWKTGASTLEEGLFADLGGSVIACSITFIIICTISIIFRFISHRINRRTLNLEDWLMIPAWALLMGLCANVVCSVELGGVGRHKEYVSKYDPKAMISWAQTLFITELIYGILIPLEKTAILLLYLRLFRIHNWFRITTYVLLAFIWMWGISELLVAIFQCKPITYQWDKTIKGSCIDQLSYYRYVRVPNTIHDVAMLVIPAPVVVKLQITFRQKLALSCVFLLGSVGCIASFVSMALFFQLDAFSDNTWASTQLMPWTLAEPGVIFICACLPAQWPIILRMISRINPSRSEPHHMENPYGFTRSKQRAGIIPANSHSSKPNHNTDDSVPLNNVRAYAAVLEVAEALSQAPTQSDCKGINVTKEFSWEEGDIQNSYDSINH